MRKWNIRIIGIQEGEEKENGAESVFKEMIAENFPNLGNERETCVEEAFRSSRGQYKKSYCKAYSSKTGKSE